MVRAQALLWLGLATLGLLSGCGADNGDSSPVPGDLDADGYSPEDGDCNESNALIHPGAEDTCNGLDDDCDGIPDPGCDADDDGHLAESAGGGDCDDTSAAVYPGAAELCDSLDNDCDTVADDVPDADGDGVGPCPATGTPDCDDLDPVVYPGAEEWFDGQANDCSGADPVERIDASSATLEFVGEYADDAAGTRVLMVRDLNGDDAEDLLVAAPGSNAGALDAGKVYVYFGGAGSFFGRLSTGSSVRLDLSTADVTLAGVNAGDRAGAEVAPVGDLNGDGLEDLWIGAPDAFEGAGAGYGVYGRLEWPPYLRLDEADLQVRGESIGDGLGVGSGGDADGDGYSDLLVGAPGVSSGRGAAWLFRSKLWTTTPEENPENRAESKSLSLSQGARIDGTFSGGALGTQLSLEGDLQGDGLRDLVVTAPGVSRVWVLLGRSGEWAPSLSEAEASFVGLPGDEAGASLAFGGDLNADQHADLVIGAPSALAGNGQAYVILGAPSALAVEVSLLEADLILDGAGGDGLGSAVALGGDVREDGYPELALGAANSDRSYLVKGWSASSVPSDGVVNAMAIAIMQGEVGTLAGAATSVFGDLNGDGRADWLIGAPSGSIGGAGSGGGYVYLGYTP